MTNEIKNHIDAARQVLVGVVPNPASQIDQITNALIYKFMDDMDQAAIRQGGDPSFFVKDLKNYAWTRLMDARIGNQERMNIYSEALVKFSESKQLPELFREIFKSAILPYRSPEVLGLFLKEINYFDYSHPEELGNAYEYLLSVMGSQGDAGQFRTPRHIIDFMVDAVDPTMEDKVLDPACGTGGFLVSAYKHILEQHSGKNKEKPLTPDQRKNLMGNFEGYDIDPGMVRIAQVNMYLHQFKGPKIYNYDTLTMEERWNDKFSVILANPPFMSPKGGVSTHSKFSIQSSRSEVLFVDYIMNHLRPNGRAGIIVPEGVIFQSGTSYKQLRKNLVEDGLNAVISLPSGVFQPYSGVKTSILLFDNEIAKQKKEILFIKIENDGFDLGSNKRPINKNDLPDALDILNKWKNGKKVKSDKVVYVERKKIAETDDYNLSGDRYRTATDYSNVKWPVVELGKVCDIFNGSTPKRTESDYWENGTIPWFTIDDIREQGHFISNTKQMITNKGFNESSVKLLPKHTTLLCCTASIGECAYTEIQLTTNQQFNGLVVNKDYFEKLNSKFLFWCSTTFKDELERMSGKSTFGFVSVSTLKKFKIPLPPLEIQEQIVKELDGYQNIITGARQIVSSWKPVIEINKEWKKIKLGEICDYAGGTQPPKSTFIDNPKEGYIRMLQIRDYKSDKNATYISKLERHKTCNETDIMIGRYGPPVFQILRGKAGAYNVALMKCLPNNDEITNDWLYYFLSSSPVQDKIISLSGRVRQAGVNPADLNDLIISLPTIEIQKQIVDRIKSEYILIEGNKKLIDIYEQKIKESLAKLWEE